MSFYGCSYPRSAAYAHLFSSYKASATASHAGLVAAAAFDRTAAGRAGPSGHARHRQRRVWGKTTLVAEFVRTQAPRHVWYQLDHTDADPFVFLGYLAHGSSQVIAGCGQATLAYLQQAPAEFSRHLEQAPERVVDVLLNEILERVEQPVVLVLDDYHHLGAETPVHALVDRLLSYLPDLLHDPHFARTAAARTLAFALTGATYHH